MASETGTAETQLSDGTLLRVEVAGRDDAVRFARVALDAAAGAVAATTTRRRDRERDLSAEAGIVGKSAPMQDLFRILDRIRGSNATALVLGENGTGKELVARAIHRMSKRSDKRFVATNCSAFNDNLLESELFGHKRGSFTGAVGDKPGLFSVADGGTFFLDEVGDMSPALQVKLLRVLQEGVFMPVGATEPKKVDVRIVAATNRDLQTMVREGTFREDLYYRLNVVQIRVPALRERKDDIPLLADFFLGRLAQRDGRHKALSRAALDRLLAHRWPGNVRELENEIERLWVLSGDEALIGEEHLSPALGRGVASTAGPAPRPGPAPEEAMPGLTDKSLPDAVESLERKMISDGLRAAKGNKTRAAEALGISRRNLIRKVQAYGLDDVGRER
ncbi:MAG: sigma 54-interacting transcriptional regulator [Sandaracinus sp.]|nr:sigma 54-interacting transcriptional regulator [Sandaracinus sp.]MCB9623844.1 sigma 54-interacting transcriptional regulator [Sandaracinus sp.]